MSLSNEEKRRRFEKALACGGNTHDVDDVVALVKEGKAQYWERDDGMIVTEIHDFPRNSKRSISGWCRDLRCGIVWRLSMTCCRGRMSRVARSRRPADVRVGRGCWRRSAGSGGNPTSGSRWCVTRTLVRRHSLRGWRKGRQHEHQHHVEHVDDHSRLVAADASQQAVGMAQNLANTPAGAPLSTDRAGGRSIALHHARLSAGGRDQQGVGQSGVQRRRRGLWRPARSGRHRKPPIRSTR